MKGLIATILSLFIISVARFSQDFLNRYPQLGENSIIIDIIDKVDTKNAAAQIE